MELSREYALSRRRAIAISNWRAGWACGAGCRELENDYAQDAEEPRGRSSGSCEQARAYNKRGCQAGGVSIPGGKATTWSSGNKSA